MLRSYQQAAVDAAIAHMKISVMPACLELATGAGKSFIVAHIAKWVNETSGKKVLCLQPSRELTEQNHQKYLLTGNRASIFSASAGSKCMRHAAVYGTPGTVKNALSRFGNQFAAVVIDECHGTTPTIKMIVERMKKANPNLRIIGMTATPYRLNTGYIYQYDDANRFLDETEAVEPFFNKLLFKIQTRELIESGFLTVAHADATDSHYDASNLQLNARGQFDAREVEQAFEGHGRLTAEIVADVVAHSVGRKGVMLFAATVAHAKEVLASLPPENSRMIGGDVNMGKADREKLISDFKAKHFKYLVSVGTLTTGFDAPHVSVVAILRATESPGLLQQIIGRGLRLCDGKDDCLVLDYAENIDRHGLHDDLFSPEIKTRIKKEGAFILNVECPECSYSNEFTGRKNEEEYELSKDGYFLDLQGLPIKTEHGDMPSHYGRRCCGQVHSPFQKGAYERCEYRWTSKPCTECEAPNDIAARYCEVCKAELIDPNEKLQRDFIRVKKDPYSTSTDKVLAWNARLGVSQNGNDTIICDYTTEYRTFKLWYTPESRHPNAQRAWVSLCDAVFSGHIAPDAKMFMKYLDKGKPPETVTYYKERNSNFYKLVAHNKPEDKVNDE